MILSSVTRRSFDKQGKIRSTLTPWAEGAKAVAKEMNVPFIDLHTLSINYHNEIGPEASMAFNPKEGDRTHFNEKGAEAMLSGLPEGTPMIAAKDLQPLAEYDLKRMVG